MAHPYVKRGKELDIVAGRRAPVVMKGYKPPRPAIRQKPSVRVLVPGAMPKQSV